MNYYMVDNRFYSSDELYHHGVKGMKWGVRRYQRKDGSLTRLGKKHQARAVHRIEREIPNKNARVNLSKMGLDNMESYNESLSRYKTTAEAKSHGYTRRAYSKEDIQEQATRYLENRLDLKTYELYKQAYTDGTIRAGVDYVASRSGKVTLTDSGREKESKIIYDAIDSWYSENKRLINEKSPGAKRYKENVDAQRTYEKKESQIIEKYNKKIDAAKSDDEKMLLEFEMFEEIDKI